MHRSTREKLMAQILLPSSHRGLAFVERKKGRTIFFQVVLALVIGVIFIIKLLR